MEDDIMRTGRCVARTMNISEAEDVVEVYELKGFNAKILKRKQGGIALYEVWIDSKPKIYE